MSTRPLDACDARWQETDSDNIGRDIVIACTGTTGHAGPHRSSTGLYWSGENWLEQLNRPRPTATTNTWTVADQAEAFVDMHKAGVDAHTANLLWPVVQQLARTTGMDLRDATTSVVSLRARLLVSGDLPAWDYDNAPVTLDWDRTPTYALQKLPHIHNTDGVCMKRRDGARCPHPDDRPDLVDEAPRRGVAE